MTELLQLDVLGPAGPYRSRRRVTVADVSGQPAAELSLAPTVYVDRAMSALRRASPLPLDERIAAITRAGRLFATGTINGQTVGEYERAVSRVAGIPVQVVRAATGTALRRTEQLYTNLQHARPSGAVGDWRDPLTRAGRAVWSRRGEVFAVHAAGNHPGTHTLWPEALALGYRVAVRPSRREPFTPHRLVTALRMAGFADDHVMLLPTDHAAAEGLLRGADLAYGSDEVIRQYADDPFVLPLRPGRSKILLTAGTDWPAQLDTVVSSISHHGGTGCVNATAVLVEGDPTPVAEALADRLALLPSLPPEDEKAVLPVQPAVAARALEKFVRDRAAGAPAHLGGGGFVEELGDGSAVLRPVVHRLESPDDPRADIELPFPCVWVAPWSPEEGIAPLRDTLVLGVYTEDERLVDALVDEPSIANVYVGDHPTHWTDTGIPHDGYLAHFLMRTKGFIRG
ncbi:acyl-CoA reductase-like NAD-dependent aldehyde dehydrogenase [Kitasatospora sp. SolWspMP-SS2h]|uniref:aldehyde dehydrogenase family protein n=1 Tax=Kitasatospora sp. SolWspMP-SS2h TaxID=1305729 RepID=UPI000DBA2C36|nr:aldehyde dehydrogenase family protein [Kitasatospora sp. SolWspMP-SS2h]RAJ43072.1 acyl-CoA reductase-like NAD-dependent aldehyde dehydrogenase [Kitasatospora sp. SolWspMP-SS2h]